MHEQDNSGEPATVKYGFIAVGIALTIIVGVAAVQLTCTHVKKENSIMICSLSSPAGRLSD